MGVLEWVLDFVQGKTRSDRIFKVLQEAAGKGELDTAWDALPQEDKDDLLIQAHMPLLRIINAAHTGDITNPIDAMLTFAMDKWLEHVKGLEAATPEEAQEKLLGEIKFMMGIVAEMHMAQKLLAKVPWANSPSLDETLKKTVTWLGFGAVLNAVAHDPVKIGMLRPWQDNLEATFRNKRFDHIETLNAYRQRSLSTIPVPEIDMITDEVMDKIEADNTTNLFGFMAKHGFKDEYITIMQDASTRALTFGNLSQMAKMGHYNRQEAIFSLWTFGMDRRIMRSSLAALETMRDVGMWKGFRSMVEPSYVQGLIEVEDLKEYWSRILVPEPVQEWALIRLTKSREKFLARQAKQDLAATRDLTKTDIVAAYKADILTRDETITRLKALTYEDPDITIILALADRSKTSSGGASPKHLSLSDYEKAHRDGIISADQVLARMEGEYAPEDIAIEKQFLAYDDLAAETIPAERDLTVSQLREAWIEDIITTDKFTESLALLGFDAEEIDILLKISQVKKDLAVSRPKTSTPSSGLTAERDLTLTQLTAAYVQNVIDEPAYTADLSSLGYDAAETAILLKLAQIKKKLPSVDGLKRLPLGDYEKAWKFGQLTADQVLDRMKGEYREEDIQLERLLLTIGKP